MTPTLDRVFGYRGDNLQLPVPNVESATAFYEQTLGFQVVSRGETPHRAVILARDAVRIGLVENGGDPTQDGCAVHVTGLAALLEEFVANGLPRPPAPMGAEQRDGVPWAVFYVVAPDGLCFWFGERTGD